MLLWIFLWQKYRLWVEMLSSRNIPYAFLESLIWNDFFFSARSPLFLILRNMQTQIIPIRIWSLDMLSTCKFDMNSLLLRCSSLTSFVVNYSLNRICMFLIYSGKFFITFWEAVDHTWKETLNIRWRAFNFLGWNTHRCIVHIFSQPNV